MNDKRKTGEGNPPGLTPAEYARRRGVTIDWVYRMIRAGRLPASRIYGRLFITGGGHASSQQ
jgi:excisionase family DNA binding protein